VTDKPVISKRDQQFFDAFLMLVGIFVGIIVGVILLGHLVGEGNATHEEEGAAQSAVVERIQPIGQVALLGDASLAAAASAPATAAAPAAAATTAALSGSQIYEQTCALCHAAGIAGAPALTDQANWEPRIAQGSDVLGEHAINGFQGQAGVMPAKGGRADLSDDDVLAAVQYMIDQVQQ